MMRSVFFCLGLFLTQVRANAPQHGFAATVNPYATKAALEAMQSGGNAVDGAIAAAITLGMVDIHNSGIGGGCFILIRNPQGEVFAIDGREMAPAAATKEMFLREGKAVPELSAQGPLAVGTPGWLAALQLAAEKYGRHPLGRALRLAADLGDQGYEPDSGFSARREAKRTVLESKFPATAAFLLAPITEGKFRHPDLAQTYRAIAEQGVDWFYRGPFAEKAAAWMKDNGGILSAQDFANYQPKFREPLRTKYRGHDIVGFPPPSSGGIHVAQMLQMLEPRDLKVMGDRSADFVHTVAEVMKRAFADRAFWLGDADFVPVPKGLLEPSYNQSRASVIDPLKASNIIHGDPPNATTDVFQKHTTHLSVADSDGWWVGLTATINTTYGSLVTIPGTGVLLNNEMDDFAIHPGVPNAFGLVGAEANAVAAGKRPLSSMSPTLVMKDGKPMFVVGAAGGPTIISQVLLTTIRLIDFGQSALEAIAAPRFHQQWKPVAIRIEKEFSPELISALQARGHTFDQVGKIGVCQLVQQLPDGTFTGAADPRVSGLAAGF